MTGTFRTGVFRGAASFNASCLFAIATLTATPGCGPGPFTAGGARVEPLTVRAVPWKPPRADVGPVEAVADAGDATALFTSEAVLFLAGGEVQSTTRVPPSPHGTWRGAAVLPGPDGQGPWLLGVDASGQLHRARSRGGLEAVSDRFGLSSPALAAASLGGALSAFFLGNGALVLADPGAARTFQLPLTRVGPTGATGTFAGGGGKAAWIAPDGPHVLDAASGRERPYPLPGAERLALDASGRLVVATAHELYAEDATGTLVLAFETRDAATSITSLAASGRRVWFLEGGELGFVEGSRLLRTTGLGQPPSTALSPSPGGDVWALAGGALARFTPAPSLAEWQSRWAAAVAPAFRRACAGCHSPGSAPRADLSTFEAWQSRRARIRLRVIDRRDMPPPGAPLDPADRAAIAAWTAAGG